jgi:hypothetical protein
MTCGGKGPSTPLPSTVLVADRVWERWRELSADSSKPWVALLFASELDSEAARRKLADAVGRVVSEFERSQDNLPDRVEEVPAGAWNLAKVPEGVMLTVGEKCGAFELLMRRVVHHLGEDGVTGSFDLYELPEVPRPPKLTDLLEARLRVNGERFPQGYHYGWAADRESLWRVATAGLGWCLESPPERGVSIQVRTLPPLPVAATDDAEGVLREGLASAENLGNVVLRSIGAERFRSLAVEPSTGRVTLVDGGSAIHGDGWVDSLRELIDLVRATSRELVYGFIKRGTLTHPAESGWSLNQDWPQPSSGVSKRGEAFEDLYVPDAFGIQLLGPGFGDRLPAGPDWNRTELLGQAGAPRASRSGGLDARASA